MMHEAGPPKVERSLGDLFGDLTQEITTLVRQEMALLKTEMRHKVSHVVRDLIFLAAGGAIAYAGLLALVAALVCLLALVMPLWAAALVVGLLVTGVGGALVWKGLSALKKEDLVPHETLDTLKEDRGGAQSTRNRAIGSG